jgi:hypothetical protein
MGYEILYLIHDQTMLVTYFSWGSIDILKLYFYHMFQRLYMSGLNFGDQFFFFLSYWLIQLLIYFR